MMMQLQLSNVAAVAVVNDAAADAIVNVAPVAVVNTAAVALIYVAAVAVTNKVFAVAVVNDVAFAIICVAAVAVVNDTEDANVISLFALVNYAAIAAVNVAAVAFFNIAAVQLSEQGSPGYHWSKFQNFHSLDQCLSIYELTNLRYRPLKSSKCIPLAPWHGP